MAGCEADDGPMDLEEGHHGGRTHFRDENGDFLDLHLLEKEKKKIELQFCEISPFRNPQSNICLTVLRSPIDRVP